MFFNFIFSGFLPENKETKAELNSILNLKKQLVEMGYNSSEIDYLIKMYGYNEKNAKDAATIKKIEAVLNDHLGIAKKCIDLVRSKS